MASAQPASARPRRGALAPESSCSMRRSLTGIDVLAGGELRAAARQARRPADEPDGGRSRDGVSTIDLIANAPGVKLVALFSPEHGIRGEAGRRSRFVAGREDGPADSLALRPDAAADDAPCSTGSTSSSSICRMSASRFYTYPVAIAYLLEEAAKRRLPVVVLDRPNPIDGFDVEGAGAGRGRQPLRRLSAACRFGTA